MHRRQKRQRGSMMVLGAGIILTLTSFAVLAFDIGRIMIVRNELQNAADSAALAGANCLPRQAAAGSATDCVEAMATTINWAVAAAKAQASLDRNQAANSPISTSDAGHQIEVGYWNLSTQRPSGGAFNTAFSPITANDKPAVRVSIRKEAGVNNGPVALLTRLIYGRGTDVPMTAQAVAVLSAPGSVPSGLIPQAINKCMFDKFWDSATNSPKLANATKLTYVDGSGKSVDIPQTIGQPWKLRIGSSYHYDACDSGQWTSFKLDANDVPTVRDLIANGSPTPLNLNDPIWIEPGTKSSLYDDLDAKYPTPPGADVTMAVVNSPDLSVHGTTTIVAFAGFHIDEIDKSKKYIEGHFTKSTVTAGSSGVGPFYGTYTPPRLGL